MKSFIDVKKKMEIAEFLKTVIHTNEEGDASYKGVWNDSLVAKQMRCSPANVRGIRVLFYPNFLSKFRPEMAVVKKSGNVTEKLAHLDMRVKFLEEELLARLTYLETELGVTPKGK